MSATGTAAQFWDQRYGGADRVWSGRVNAVLAQVADGLAAGRALDLGCGEGGDAVWLAARGWQVTAVDVSAVALARVREAAAAAGLAERVATERHDLDATFPAGGYDLVSAQFLQSPVEFGRAAVLRRAADAVAPGGVLLVVAHAGPPSWAPAHTGPVAFATPDGDLADLRLGPGWTVLRRDLARRAVTGPDGEAGTLDDSVLAVRRG